MDKKENVNLKIESALFDNQDLKYKEFQAKLIPDIDFEKIIGVRTPIIKSLAKEFAKEENIVEFLNKLPHKYYDENNLHGFIICNFKDYDKTIAYLNDFLPYVDNWATCDFLRPKSFKDNKEKLKSEIYKWIYSEHTYVKRFGMEMAMAHFLDCDFDERLLSEISKIRSDEYYIKMMIAWYFATALAKQWEITFPYIKDKKLDIWTHNKAIQKLLRAIELQMTKRKF